MIRFILVLMTISSLALGRNINIKPTIDQNFDGRIVGGINTTIEEHPYQVSVQLYNGHWCGGSIIRPNAVLTAAHCVKDWKARDFRIRAGTTIKETGGQIANVVSICSHPKFNQKLSLDYDVSVLLLDRSFEFGVGVQKIELQPIGVEVPTGTVATVTGWGALASGATGPDILQEVQVPKVDYEVCKSKYIYKAAITDRMTCYGSDEGGKDSCQGDSGGPLVANGKQVGVVSFGERCAVKEYPGVYARVENEEIQNHINYCIR